MVHAASILKSYGIERVQLHCPALKGKYCVPAARLLNAGLGLPERDDDGILIYRVRTPWAAGESTDGVSGGISAMVTVTGTAQCQAGDANLRAGAGEARSVPSMQLVLPVPGRWSITGEMLHAGAAPPLLLDNEIPAATFTYSDTIQGFRVEQVLGAGEHRLTLSDAATGPAGLPVPCLQGVIARLEDPAVLNAGSLDVDFANEEGLQYRLDAASVIPIPPGSSVGDAGQLALLTAWRVQRPSGRPEVPGEAPDLYVHITDPAGELVSQADHRLARQSVWESDGSYFYDLVPLPWVVSQHPEMELRIGLWLPESQRYYWITDSTRVDASNRLPLGSVGSLSPRTAGSESK